MEDISNWLYIIAGIVYFIYQLRSAKKKAPQESKSTGQDKETTTPTVSFEDILKEILEERKIEERPKPAFVEEGKLIPVVVKKPSSESLSRPTSFKKPDVQKLPSKKLIKDKAPKAKIEADYNEIQNLESTDPSTGLESDYQRGSIFKEFQQEEKKENAYAKILKNPKSLKEAVIVSEILKTKF